eukprot:6211948-Pleurochrysis_carterae.AAC.2
MRLHQIGKSAIESCSPVDFLRYGHVHSCRSSWNCSQSLRSSSLKGSQNGARNGTISDYHLLRLQPRAQKLGARDVSTTPPCIPHSTSFATLPPGTAPAVAR